MLPLILQPVLSLVRFHETRFQLKRLDRRIQSDIGVKDGKIDAFIRERECVLETLSVPLPRRSSGACGQCEVQAG